MKLTYLIPLAPLATAFVIPEEHVLAELGLQRPQKQQTHQIPIPEGWLSRVDTTKAAAKVEHTIDDVLETLTETKDYLNNELDAASRHVKSWWNSERFESSGTGAFSHPRPQEDPHHPPHNGHPPHHDKPGHGRPPHGRDPHRGHPPHDFSNYTIYELITKSKYTTKLAKLIKEDEELFDILNSTSANYTLFAPTDKAFERIPHHGKEPSKEFIKAVLLYHISPHAFPARALFHTNTVPTLLKPAALGEAQRLRVGFGLRGLTFNFYSHVVAGNFFVSNGVIHAIDAIIVPPPSILTAISLLPAEFSTLSLGLSKTGLDDAINSTTHVGATFFAPSNDAFKKLGPRINAFLFSKYGEKYLKALLEYHTVLNQTLYSDAFYSSVSDKTYPPRRNVHVDLPTLLDDKSLSIDIARWGPFTTITINAFNAVKIIDGVAKDGVIQLLGNVIIPPKKPESAGAEPKYWQGEELTVEDLKERLEPYVQSEFEGRTDL